MSTQLTPEDTLAAIQAYGLLVRPSVFTLGFVVGKFRGITGHPLPQAYCYHETTYEAATVAEAIALCVQACESKGWGAQK